MTASPQIYKGNDASIWITAGSTRMTHTTLAISDFSLTFDKGTVEQELVGETGNYFIAGSLSIDGSLTSCKIHTSAVGNIVSDMIDGVCVQVSGNCATAGLHFYFLSAQVTGFDFSLGDGDTITEGSIDFSILKPYKVSGVGLTPDQKYILITDQPIPAAQQLVYP